MNDKKILRIYKKLYKSFGKQYWWPAKTKLEVIIGAMLTQNTAWSNVEKAIGNLRKNKKLSFKKLYKIKTDKLAVLIKPAGYFNIKAKRLKNLLEFIKSRYNGNLENMQRENTQALRGQLLSVNGVGPETADSILLYALDKPVFVVDAYTKRIFSKIGIISSNATYEDIQEFFMNNLKRDTYLFNEYHALIVKLGKDYCKKNRPNCKACPIKEEICSVPTGS
ncbi:MAG: endonuclease III domain-containing protein [Candidatus Omnitrophica bacterium]|nr:endonuclease III domain-containing protein [Candidatus Omnitrophota bacterium]MDD5351671.1 endonuclease III domain-containing protein [Candidatus Omnitrophota bacterium]MDD5550881.1 endonuclease III domain-containing protein [Candidatus Omnitrophota bacterium]